MSRDQTLASVLAQSADCRSVIECGTRSLECGQGRADDRHLDEATCLRYGLKLFEAAYDSLDRATFTNNGE